MGADHCVYCEKRDCIKPWRGSPVSIWDKRDGDPGPLWVDHSHEQMEFLYLAAGEARAYCNGTLFRVKAGDLVLVNAHEPHHLEHVGHLACHAIRVDFSLLSDNLCQMKYVVPLVQNKISFRNMIDDERVIRRVRNMIDEYHSQEAGFELAVKAAAEESLVLLFRGHLKKSCGAKEEKLLFRNVERFRPVLDFVEAQYAERISLDQLAAMVNMSKHHFCHLFKQITGRAPGDYINRLRMDKALALLKGSDLNITEIALASGFSDSNYFCRVFTKCHKVPPSRIRKGA